MWKKFDIKKLCEGYKKRKFRNRIRNPYPSFIVIPNPNGYGPTIEIQLYNREELFRNMTSFTRILSDGIKINETVDMLEVIEE